MIEDTARRSVFPYFIAITCATFWGMSFLSTTIALQRLSPISLIAMQWTVSAAIFILLILLRVIKVNYKHKNLKWIFAVGALQPCAYSILEANGINQTTASEASIFIATVPLVVLIIGRYVSDVKTSLKTKLAILLAFIGVIICTVFSPSFSIGGKGTGYLLLFGAVIANALYSYGSNKASKHFNAIELTCGISVIGCIFFNIVNCTVGNGFKSYLICFHDTKTLVAVIFLGSFCSCLCYIMYNYVLAKLPTVLGINLISNLATAIGVLSGCVFAGDPFGWYTIVGLILTITGICLATIAKPPGAE